MTGRQRFEKQFRSSSEEQRDGIKNKREFRHARADRLRPKASGAFKIFRIRPYNNNNNNACKRHVSNGSEPSAGLSRAFVFRRRIPRCLPRFSAFNTHCVRFHNRPREPNNQSVSRSRIRSVTSSADVVHELQKLFTYNRNGFRRNVQKDERTRTGFRTDERSTGVRFAGVRHAVRKTQTQARTA